jgi:hypothetical protein
MELKITNCNNIDSGKIEITNNKLNIKFGINGTGKSTITRAIKYSIDSPEQLKELIPFKHRQTETEVIPEINISEEIKSVLIFNEDYLNQFLFKEDELISNIMNIENFIKNWISASNAFDIEKYLSYYQSEAVLDDPSVGRKFEGHKGIHQYFDSYFIGYNTHTEKVKLKVIDEVTAHLEVQFTGDFPATPTKATDYQWLFLFSDIFRTELCGFSGSY